METLCGRKSCKHLCGRSIYCQAGQERASLLLGQQRQRRETRRQEARKFQQDIENAIPVFAGSFKAFQSQLQWEREQLADDGFSYSEYLENYNQSEASL